MGAIPITSTILRRRLRMVPSVTLCEGGLMNYFVYILRLADNSFCVGYTENLKDRVSQHNQKQCKTTKDNLPVKLVWYSVFTNKKKAQNFERYLKSGSGTAFRRKRLI